MISADVKDNKNNKNKRSRWLYLTNFYKKYLQNWKHNVKKFGKYSIHLDIFRYEHGVGFFLLNGQNPLSVSKVICGKCLKTWRK